MQRVARPREFIEAPLDRTEDEDDVQNDSDIRYSADPDARWIKKGSTSVLGYKGFIRVDDEGFVDKVHTTPANRDECPEFKIMLEHDETPVWFGSSPLLRMRKDQRSADDVSGSE